MRKISFCPFLLMMAWAGAINAIESGVIIKVNGGYGIISQGVNQGIEEGQIFYVRRETATGLKEVAQVKVIRATANRAAIEQISPNTNGLIEKGDQLFTDRAPSAVPTPTAKSALSSVPRLPKSETTPSLNYTENRSKKGNIEPITEPVHKSVDVPTLVPPTNFSGRYDLKRPWISFNIGSTFPTGNFSNVYSPSLNLGASYMVAVTRDLNLGVEINKSFLGDALFGGNDTGVGSVNSSSILEGLVVFQKYFGGYFFVEGGGGIFRPKIQTVSVDNVESSFSSSNFGIFGGTGFFVPTSQYAGFTVRGRVHNYFDQTSRQYFGLAGGFRFKIQ